MLKKIVVFLFLFFMTVSPILAQGRDAVITGKVVDIDWLKRKLTIRHADPRSGRSDQITVQVPKGAELSRGTRSISFLDINKSDSVTVTYYSDDMGGLKVRQLSNLNLGNR
jgi:hypothetical protein